MRKLFFSLVTLIALVAFGIATAEAANPAPISVTVTITKTLSVSVGPAAWAIPDLSEGATADTVTGGTTPGFGNNFTVTNDSNASSTLTTTVGNSGNWTFAANPGTDIFAMDQSTTGDIPTWTEIVLAGSVLASPAAKTNVSFDLKFYAPTTTTAGGTAQTITVTVTAS